MKADVKHNYYADLELPTSASIEDVRKAYRKLALQYHPDRNSGREDECVPKFQAIQMANEVLGDAASKQKYDGDRRRAGLFPTGQTWTPRQPAPGNPYAANSAFPPPPRRTQPGTWQRPPPPTPGTAPGQPPTGADRFTNFPRAAPTARKDPAQERANQFKAWQNLNNTQERQQNFNTPPPRASHQPPPQAQAPPQYSHQQRQRPQPPPRQDTKLPTEEQIRAGMKHRAAPQFDAQSPNKPHSAWQSVNQGNAPPTPGISRADSMRNPNRQGYNPHQPGDEKASGSHVHRNRSADFGKPAHPGLHVPPPPNGPPPTSNPTTPHSPIPPERQRPSADPTRPFRSQTPNDQVPFSEANRSRTPYSSFIHEKTDIGEGLRRSYSVRDTTKLGPEDAAARGRARSTSPMSRQPAGGDQTNGATQQKPFVVYSDSEVSNEDTTETSEDADGTSPKAGRRRPGTAPPGKTPLDRPKKTPTPPSRFQSAAPTNGQTDPTSAQQKAQDNMYDHPISFTPHPSASRSDNFRSFSSERARRLWSTAGSWALPSSVNPFAKKAKKGVVKGDPSVRQEAFVTAADPVYIAAREDERNAYLRLQTELGRAYDVVPGNLNMTVFLELVSVLRKGTFDGPFKLRFILQRVLNDFPSVGTSTDNAFVPSSFTFPHNETLFTSTNAKSRSEEAINTNFSPDGWAGVFAAEPEYFAPPRTNGKKQQSPNRRTNRAANEPPRSATMDVPSAPREGTSPRPFGSDGTPTGVPPQAGSEVKFSQEQWQKTFQDPSWTWPPPPPRPGSPARGGATPGARKPSQGRKSSRAANKNAAASKQAHVEDVGSASRTDGLAATAESPTPMDDGDAMDIDDTPPATQATNEAHDAQSRGADKGARMYSVPPSTWRQQQGQHPATTLRPTEASNDGSALNTKLDDLRNVEPIANPAPGGSGLEGLGSMSTSLPFKSGAASKTPITTATPMQIVRPPAPVIPSEPTRLSKQSWMQYAKHFGDYCTAYHSYSGSMLRNINAIEEKAASRFANGCGWLVATGDTSGMTGEPSGFGPYAMETKQAEREREAWYLVCEKHSQGVEAFRKVRERAKKLALEGMLPDV